MRHKRFMFLAVALVALNTFFWLAGSGAAGALGGLGDFFFGPKLVRAEVLVAENGTTNDYRIDRGVVRSLATGSLTIQERNGEVVTVPVDPGAQVSGSVRSFFQIRKRMHVTTIRIGDGAATRVQVTLR